MTLQQELAAVVERFQKWVKEEDWESIDGQITLILNKDWIGDIHFIEYSTDDEYLGALLFHLDGQCGYVDFLTKEANGHNPKRFYIVCGSVKKKPFRNSNYVYQPTRNLAACHAVIQRNIIKEFEDE